MPFMHFPLLVPAIVAIDAHRKCAESALQSEAKKHSVTIMPIAAIGTRLASGRRLLRRSKLTCVGIEALPHEALVQIEFGIRLPQAATERSA
jgi:hypothetical protein